MMKRSTLLLNLDDYIQRELVEDTHFSSALGLNGKLLFDKSGIVDVCIYLVWSSLHCHPSFKP